MTKVVTVGLVLHLFVYHAMAFGWRNNTKHGENILSHH